MDPVKSGFFNAFWLVVIAFICHASFHFSRIFALYKWEVFIYFAPIYVSFLSTFLNPGPPQLRDVVKQWYIYIMLYVCYILRAVYQNINFYNNYIGSLSSKVVYWKADH